MQSFKLLNKSIFFTETLRKYAVSMLTRTCMNDYKIPGTNKIIEKGVEVMIPIFSIHRDELYFERPHEFDPDRFNEENSVGKNHLNRPYYPFGKYFISCNISVNVAKVVYVCFMTVFI